jgi:hypothetical protein
MRWVVVANNVQGVRLLDDQPVHPGKNEIVVYIGIFAAMGGVVFAYHHPAQEWPLLPYLAFAPALLGVVACYYTNRLFEVWGRGDRGPTAVKLQNSSSNWSSGALLTGFFLVLGLIDVVRASYS